ncbi:MAG: hypothetical protein Q7S52_04840 [bacterium]|nr:hypothetical protein [bacterium]
MKKITRETLKEYWWYRLLKVVFIVIILLISLGVIGGAFSEKPTLNEYGSTYQIKCDIDGQPRGNIDGSDLSHWGPKLSFISDSTAQLTRFVCLDPSKILDRDQFETAYEQARRDGTISTTENYEILLREPAYYGSWQSFALILVLGLLGVGFFAWLIQSIFLYVLIGEKPRTPFHKKVLRTEEQGIQ